MFRSLFALLCLLLAASLQAPVAHASEPLTALVSIAPQKYILERIVGEDLNLEVSVLVKPGSDPHAYEPSPSQIRAASVATCWFTIGVPFEDIWLERIKGAAPDLVDISMIDGITRLPWNFAEEDKKDPHVWLSPMLVREITDNVTRKLCRLAPEKAADFRRNARAFMDELEALDMELALRFKDFAPAKRVFLTYHPSWRYFAHSYELTELSIEADGKEPGPKTLKNILEAAKTHGVRTIFVEPQFPKTAAQAIAQALDAEIVEADPLAEDLPALYKDMADKLVRAFTAMKDAN
ncbi:zinc ABC transporter substrate-binding protein [Desulfovibrio sp. OttesenSCG-928-M16]|nr:zinc ABC transporter substrate-binding protein [Desulfovibrio sp. OttesenSCG-928-M16]